MSLLQQNCGQKYPWWVYRTRIYAAGRLYVFELETELLNRAEWEFQTFVVDVENTVATAEDVVSDWDVWA
jgi:hypothetical protein